MSVYKSHDSDDFIVVLHTPHYAAHAETIVSACGTSRIVYYLAVISTLMVAVTSSNNVAVTVAVPTSLRCSVMVIA
jgi:hypothetical protein